MTMILKLSDMVRVTEPGETTLSRLWQSFAASMSHRHRDSGLLFQDDFAAAVNWLRGPPVLVATIDRIDR